MSDLPNGLEEFMQSAGWADAVIAALPGDASFRRYFRLMREGQSAMLMYAPPPEEDPAPFLKVARYLSEQGMRAPEILAENAEQGWVLTEDFGDERVREWIDAHPADEEAIYAGAIDALIALHGKPAGPFDPYDMAVYQREAALLTEWYCPAMELAVDSAGYAQAWEQALEPLVARQQTGVTVLRDYHAENIMLPPDGGQGLIDFQDALVGHPAYDLVSLLQDARRDVSEDLERAMLARYMDRVDAGEHFLADYALLGAQRNAKIVGIFTRLAKRDGKARYLEMIPRVWAAMERDLVHPSLAPVATWFDANIPQEIRAANGAGLK
ncbi:aminoglycoside phosphotransferase family protein [Qipengyuania sp. DGS5-3]|uniref:aminoglycoside phosphotransferase family protein n=1 Tax=Qipengyuania sp. DGS5-3 TaxID=3349632 RepID=UPI0036D38D4D